MIIILEGPDGGGKTTLANTLSKHSGWPIKHFSYPKTQEEVDNMFSMYLDMLNSLEPTENVILDRCWYSDMCYGPVMRGAATITTAKMLELEEAALKHGCMVVLCIDEPTVLWQRVSKRGDDYITDEEKFYEICNYYIEVFFNRPHVVPVSQYWFVDTANGEGK